MDYKLYDRLQAQLGGVGDSFEKRVKSALMISGADPETKSLVNTVSLEVKESLNNLAGYISDALIASSK